MSLILLLKGSGGSPTILLDPAVVDDTTVAATLTATLAMAPAVVDDTAVAATLTATLALAPAVVDDTTVAAALSGPVLLDPAVVDNTTLAATLRLTLAMSPAVVDDTTLAATVTLPVNLGTIVIAADFQTAVGLRATLSLAPKIVDDTNLTAWLVGGLPKPPAAVGGTGTVEVRLYGPTGLGAYTVLTTRIAAEWHHENSKRGGARIVLPVAAAATVTARSIVKMYWAGAERFGFVVTDDACTVAAADSAEVAGQRVVDISGPGLLSLLGDAPVQPEYGLGRASDDDRRFGYMSATGPWFSNIAWGESTYPPYTIASSLRGPTFPADFPDTAAFWVGANVTTVTPGYAWFRKVFATTVNYDAVRLSVSSDDDVEWYLDGQLLLNVAGDWTCMNSTYTADTVDFRAGTHVLAARTTDNSKYSNELSHGEVVATLHEILDQGGSADAPVLGTKIVQTDSSWLVQEDLPGGSGGAHTGGGLVGWRRAQVILKLLAEAQAAGYVGALRLTAGFTDSTDSAGQSWTDIGDFSFPVGTTLLEVVEQLAEAEIDVDVDPVTMTLNAWKRRGSNLSNSVGLTLAGNLAEYETARTTAPVNVAWGHLSDGTWATVEDGASITQWGGRIGRRVDLGATADYPTARQILTAVLAQTKGEQVQIMARPGLLVGATPYVSYGMGDTVSCPGHLGVGTIAARVLAINVVQNGETAEAWPELVPDPS